MIGDLEYLMTSLPHLSFQNTEEERRRVVQLLERYAGQSEPVSVVQLLDREAKKFLSDKAYSVFHRLDLDTIFQPAFQQSESAVIAQFSTYVRGLKEEVRLLRLRRKEQYAGSEREHKTSIALSGTPLEEEVQLLRYQWDKLEELSVGHYADLEALVLYKLKLLILVRWWRFDSQLGFQKFSQLIKEY